MKDHPALSGSKGGGESNKSTGSRHQKMSQSPPTGVSKGKNKSKRVTPRASRVRTPRSKSSHTVRAASARSTRPSARSKAAVQSDLYRRRLRSPTQFSGGGWFGADAPGVGSSPPVIPPTVNLLPTVGPSVPPTASPSAPPTASPSAPPPSVPGTTSSNKTKSWYWPW